MYGVYADVSEWQTVTVTLYYQYFFKYLTQFLKKTL